MTIPCHVRSRQLSLNGWHRVLLAGLTTLVVSGVVGSAPPAQAVVRSSVGQAVEFSCNDSEATIRRKNGPSVAFGNSRIYIGYQQVSRDNKNPVMVRFHNGRQIWCRNNYEVTGDDGEGYGLLWNGRSILYGVFSATGTQGQPSWDYRRFTRRGWLRSYGSGGGPKAAVILRIHPSNGLATHGTFVSSVLSNGRTNSLRVRRLGWTGSRLVVTSSAWYSPRDANGRAMNCRGSSPFPYRIWLRPNLSGVTRVQAGRCR